MTFADADQNAEPATVAFVSEDFFKTVGVWPAAGRAFREADDVVLPAKLWSSRFNSDPGIIGQRVWQGYGEGEWSSQHTVAGVMPAGFEVCSRAIDFLQPLDIAAVANIDGNNRDFAGVIGRLRPGMSLEQAQSRADTFSAYLARENPARNRGWQMRLVPVTEDSTGEFRPFMTALMGALAFMLLILCTNVATLLMGKTATRGKEIAVRVALGASRGRIMWHLVTESLVAIAGAMTGLGLAYVVVSWLRASLPRRRTWGAAFLQADGIRIDEWVVGFAVLAALVVGGLFGLIPAVRASNPNLEESLKDAALARGHRQRPAP